MKQTCIAKFIGLIAVLSLLGCGQSDDRMKEVVKVGGEIAEVQKEYYPAITELGKVSIQIEALGQRQDPAAKVMANEVAKAQELIKEAFMAGQKAQDGAVVGMPKGMTHEQYILAQQAFRDLLKEALGRTNAAVTKAHEVLQALPDLKSAKGVGKN